MADSTGLRTGPGGVAGRLLANAAGILVASASVVVAYVAVFFLSVPGVELAAIPVALCLAFVEVLAYYVAKRRVATGTWPTAPGEWRTLLADDYNWIRIPAVTAVVVVVAVLLAFVLVASLIFP